MNLAPKAASVADTAMAAAFKRALVARAIDIKEVHKVKDADAREIFRETRWADTDGEVTCPKCKAGCPWEMKWKLGAYKCRNPACDYRFTLTAKTCFHAHKLPLQRCLVVLGAAVENGMTASRLADVMDVTYKTALSFAHTFGLPDGRRGNVKSLPLMNYPYRDRELPPVAPPPGYDLVSEINSLMPRNLYEDMRADVSQELCLAVLCGDVDRDKIKLAVPEYISRYYKMFRWKFADLSLDAIVPGTDNLTIGGTLHGDRSFEYWERR